MHVSLKISDIEYWQVVQADSGGDRNEITHKNPTGKTQ